MLIIDNNKTEQNIALADNEYIFHGICYRKCSLIMNNYTSDKIKELKLKYLTNSVEKLHTIATPPEKKQERILFCELYILL